MKKYLFIALVVIALATATTVILLRIKDNKKIAGVVTTQSPSPSLSAQYPKPEKYEVPILMYHYIRNAPEGDKLSQNLSVSPVNFKAQMDYLKNRQIVQ